jgi:hypothetical protein
MRDSREAIERWLSERSVNEEAIVVTDKGKGDHTDRLEYAIVY